MTYDFLRIILLLFVYFLRFIQLQLYGLNMYSSSSTCHLIIIQLKNKYEHKQHLQEQQDILIRNKMLFLGCHNNKIIADI